MSDYPIIRFLTAAALLGPLAACNPSSSTDPVADRAPEAPIDDFSFAPIPTGATGLDSFDDFTATMQLINSDANGTSRLSPVYASGVSLAAREAEAARLLALAGDDPQGNLIRQVVSVPMLQHHVKASEPDLDAVALYTDLAINAQSTDAATTAKALALLDGVWTRERIAAAAGRASDATSRWLQTDCPDCATRSASGVNFEPLAAPGEQQQRAIDGLHALDALK